MIYACCDEHRKAAIASNPTLNGIDYLEVLDHAAIALGSPRQQTLLVHCLKRAPATLVPSNVLIEGGERVTGITAAWVAPALPAPPEASAAEAAYFGSLADAANVLVIRTSVAGDFSPYTLRLVNNATQASGDVFAVTEVLKGFDPQLASVAFSFKVECGPDFDCKPLEPPCPPDAPAPPPINYLAKDYGSFRTVLLDRLNQLLPAWQASTEADIGVVLAELLAYVGDHFSYRQDAVTTESYLLTARSRISLRRHALLVDYTVSEGCNARAWICVQVGVPVFLDHRATRFYTVAPNMPPTLLPGSGNEQAALDAGVVAFEPMQDANLHPEHNEMAFYTWGDTNCCLPKGATTATLLGTYPNLQPGDVLVFEEILGPQTGNAADADVRHRCAVRLTQVATQDAQGAALVDPLFEQGTGAPITGPLQRPTPVTEIRWSDDDALPFPVCLSSTFLDDSGQKQTLTGVSRVLGNVVLADQGLTMPGEALPDVPEPALYHPPSAARHCTPQAGVPFPVRYRPALRGRPLTHAIPLPVAGSPVTPGPVPLPPNGYVSLVDANGFVCLMVSPDAPGDWPQYFAILTESNALNPATFDLSVIFAPPGGPVGVSAPVVIERFAGLTLTAGAPNNALKQIAALSRFIAVAPGFTPPAATPSPLPLAQTQLSSNGTVALKDAGGATFLVVQPTPPTTWPPMFGVLAQDDISQPDTFNLVLVFQPASGGVGVQVPVVVEQFNGVSLANVATTFGDASDLLSVRSFEDEPNPALSARALMQDDIRASVPAVQLVSTFEGTQSTWTPSPNLLGNGPEDTVFVVETDTDGTARLRFGDGTNGRAPVSLSTFTACGRIGNGTPGNVGADTIVGLAADPRVIGCRNPLAASGGVDPETNDQIRRRAPQAFMTQERAITMTDYANVTEANTQVEDAVAALRWTGSWYTVFITAEPQCAGVLTPALRRALTRYVNRFRLAGQDLKIEGPDYLSLDISLTICVAPDYFQRDVQKALQLALGSGSLPDGQPAFFAPGRFELGQPVYLSPLYAAARAVAGVASVTATVFQPQGVRTSTWLQQGAIPVGPFQVARMANDPSLPDHGRLTLVMQGGK
ncbi:putative baseplate assembly protein [Paraburkholderia acidiphila]|uniref:Putative baseplate assembly protein n=1 Tax=Paraburkholderia acidiphila TaxID=2571747 RepID=A0A7Z2GCV1_9BURK|nr:putative baseplate assembly protein [Paraburkholderia acidiphila]QGZ59456.1 putative baseplate assembly protein [Paraburkholderia acidiphila]